MFSFLCSAYRNEDTLARTVEAVRAQTRADWELIIVDNGNSEAIVAIAAPYLSDPRISLIRHENRGVTGGVKSASEVATGRYLVVLNSDDSVTPDFCARTGSILDTAPAIAAVTCDAHLFIDPGEVRLPRGYLSSAGARGRRDGTRPLRVAEVIDGPCPYYSAPIRRDVWDAMGGMSMTDTPLVNDLDFWLRTLLSGYDVRMIPDKLGLFRIQAGSESRPTDPSGSERFEDQRERVLMRAAQRSGDLADSVALERVLRRLRYQQAVRRARVAIQRGSALDARRHLEVALAQRRTARVRAILVGLRLAPSTLIRLHPVKQRLQARLERRLQRLPNRTSWPKGATQP